MFNAFSAISDYITYIIFGAMLVLVAIWALFKYLKRPVSDACMRQGEKLIKEEKFDLAVVQFEKALKVKRFTQGKPYTCWNNIAVCYLELGEYEKAQEAINMSLALSSVNVMAFAVQGRLYFEQHNYFDAIESLKKKVAVMPEDANVYSLLAVCFAKVGDKANANTALTKAEQNKYAGINELRKMVKDELRTIELEQAEAAKNKKNAK